MAYVESDLTPEEQQQQQLQQQGGNLNSPGPVSGASGLLSSGTSSNPGVTVASQPTPQGQASPAGTGSGFVNLQSYLNANKDQASNFAGQLASGISQTGQGAQSAIDNAAGQYSGTLSAQNTPYDSGLVSRATADPTNFVKNQDDLSKFSAIRDNSYQDPGTFEGQAGYSDISKKAQTAQDNANLVKTEGGRQTLIQKNNPTSGQGVNNLDNLLISGNPDAQQTLLKASQPYADLKNYLGTATQNADTAHSALLSNNAANQKQLQDQFITPETGVLSGLENSATQQKNSAGQQRTQTNRAIQDLRDYVGGKYGSLDPNEAQLFNQPGATAGYDESALRQAISGHFPIGSSTYAAINDPAARQAAQQGDINNVLNYSLGRQNAIERPEIPYADSVKSSLGQYQLSPTQYLKNNSQQLPSNWLDKYFPGTNEAQSDPTIANISNPQDAAKMVALEQLLGGNSTQFLNPDDLEQAGTYQPSTIGKWAGL